MSVLILSQNGAYSNPGLTLAQAAVSPQLVGKTIVVTSPQVVTTAIAWPDDRELKFEKGGYVTFTGAGSLTGLKEARPEQFGGEADGVTDCTAAISNAIKAVMNSTSGRVVFDGNGNYDKYYKTTSTITITGPTSGGNALVLQGIADSVNSYYYGHRIHNSTSGPIFAVKMGGVTFKDMAFSGNGGVDGVGATVDGLHIYGTPDGDLDTAVLNCSFQYLALPVKTFGRNINIRDSQFNNSLAGILFGFRDPAYNTGVNATQIRGLLAERNRFHNIGVLGTATGAVEIQPDPNGTDGVLHFKITDNFFDSAGYSIPIKAVGSAAKPHNKGVITDNKLTGIRATGISTDYVYNTSINNNQITGDPTDTTNGGSGITVAHGNNIDVKLNSILQPLYHGISVTATDTMNIHSNTVKNASNAATGAYDGVLVDGTSTNAIVTGNSVVTTDGYGLNIEATVASISSNYMVSCALGEFKSDIGHVHTKTLKNIMSLQTGMGNFYNVGTKIVNLTPGTPVLVGTVTFDNTYSAGFIEVEMTARDGVSTSCYVVAKRVIVPENTTPVVTTIGTDATALASITFTNNGAGGVIEIKITGTGTAQGAVTIKTSGGGDANTTGKRGLVLVM